MTRRCRGRWSEPGSQDPVERRRTRYLPGPGDSWLHRCPRVVVFTGWEWNDRSGSKELTGSPGGYLEPFPRLRAAR